MNALDIERFESRFVPVPYGPIPPGMFVCHRCDVRPCVNPDHLFLGTQSENIQDMVTKGRAGGAPRLLTDSQVVELRLRYAAGEPSDRLATFYGVSTRTVVGIAAGRKRKRVGGPRTTNRQEPRRLTDTMVEAARAVRQR